MSSGVFPSSKEHDQLVSEVADLSDGGPNPRRITVSDDHRARLSGAPPFVSFMVFLQICLDVARGRGFHAPHEPLVEHFRGVVPGITEQVIQRDDLGAHCDVFAWIQKHRVLGKLDFQNRGGLNVQT
jgi:hypothetical protein